MPYKVVKSGSGYKVKNKKTGKTYSNNPLSKDKADAQLKALYANTSESKMLISKINKRLMQIDEAMRYMGKQKPCDPFLDRVIDRVNNTKYDVEDRKYVEKPEFLAMLDNLLDELEELRLF